MKPLHQSPIKVKPSNIHGYGVFADADIEPGSLIEECHTLATQSYHAFNNYVFNYKENDELKIVLPLGYGAIYNHSNEPNAECTVDLEHSLMVITALRHILAGEEIFLSYGTRWFDERKIKPLQQNPLFFLRLKLKRMMIKSSFIMRAILCISAIYLALYIIPRL